jgi:hypothetical protein
MALARRDVPGISSLDLRPTVLRKTCDRPVRGQVLRLGHGRNGTLASTARRVPPWPPRYYLCTMQVSILDLSPVTTGSSGAAALKNSIDLAKLADRLGFARYWVAEHHN